MDIFFTLEKLDVRIDSLAKYRFRAVTQMEQMMSCPCPSETVNPPLPDENAPWQPVHIGDTWSGRDTYLWLKCDAHFPDDTTSGCPVGVFDFGRTGNCNCSGFESQLFVDGEPYQGVDTHHNEVFFPESWAGTTRTLIFRIWSGLEGGGVPQIQEHRFSEAFTAKLDADTDYLYYMGKMLLGTIKLLNKNDPLYDQLLSGLNKAENMIDRRALGSDSFYSSVSQAAEYLRSSLGKIDSKLPVNVLAVGNTHIDVAWLWRYKHTREKSARSFSTVLRLMEKYPEYSFLMSQPQLYEYIRNDFPTIYQQIKERIAEGRWEIEGGMWIEADCNIPSGESLTRQFLIGKGFAKKEFGKDMRILWLPDVFGYSWALPQILKKSGIDTFVTTKISWNECNQMPYDTFEWKGIDGTSVLAHFITTPAAAEEQGSWYYTYNGEMLPSSVTGIWNNYKNKNLTNELLLAYGYGDGGGGVNREELEQRRLLDSIPGLPHVTTGSGVEYFKRLHEKAENFDGYFPEWDGELYLENHRGTYTSHAYNKRMNRYLEHLYRCSEWISVLARTEKGYLSAEAKNKLTEGWKLILLNQFHDVIPGSAIYEVYEDSKEDYRRAENIAQSVISESLNIMRDDEKGMSLINSGIWPYKGSVRVPLGASETLVDRDGKACRIQHLTPETAMVDCFLPPMSITPFSVAADVSEQAESPFVYTGKELDTPLYKVSFDEIGRITRLFDKTASREIVPEGETANRLVFFEDEPVICDAWNINIFYNEKAHEVEKLTETKIIENGALAFTLYFRWEYGNSAIEENVTFYANEKKIDFEAHVDMHETHQLLKVAFPIEVRTTFATYDIQYGNVRRANNWNTSWDIAKFETVMHKWVDLSDSDYGVSVMNNGKYGCDVKGNTIRLSLIKTATYPDYLQDQGEHSFTYSLFPHEGDALHCDVEKESFYLNDPVRCAEGTISSESFVSVSADNISLDAVKQSEEGDCLVVRFHEYRGSASVCSVKTAFQFSEFAECDLMENPVTEFMGNQEEITLRFHPYEIKTLLFKL
ncbi:MAG: alpha-mannosidase [Eubacteriales bacterium]|nr:alpha-mannosidase [Eubacteriales bacterium]